MTQVFADDDQAGDMGMLTRGVQIPRQAAYRASPALSPAMMPGKGVRPIRCVGCARDTLPRTDDGAPLCHRCSELLAAGSAAGRGAIRGGATGRGAAGGGAAALATVSWPAMTTRWLRRRPAL